MSEWDFARVKYTAPHNVPCLIEAADAAIAKLEAELSIEQKENRRLRERLECCGNCASWYGGKGSCIGDAPDSCHFIPSRWK